MRRVSVILGLVLLSTGLIYLSCFAQAPANENITITTYYPAPYGVYKYKEIRADQMSIGSTYRTTATLSDGDLIVEGSVGIGTTNPQFSQDLRVLQLDVKENIVAKDVYLDTPKSGLARWASDATSAVTTGTYKGNDSGNREIPIGFRPKVVIVIKQEGGGRPPEVRTDSMPNNYSKGYGGNKHDSGSHIRSFTNNGFRVGSNGKVNASGNDYHWYAFR